MPMSILVLASLLALAVTSASGSLTQQVIAAAAKCSQSGPACKNAMASHSIYCRSGLWMSQQSEACRVAACAYCMQHKYSSEGKLICASPAFKNNCPARRSGSAPKKCTLKAGNNGMIIPASALDTPSHWSRLDDGSIVWRADGGWRIDPPGSGSTCARFTVRKAGQYYLTVDTASPHAWEHNDLWIRLSSGVDLFRPEGGHYRDGGAVWRKGYQKAGRGKRAKYLLTIDSFGHQFISKPLMPGKEYTVCLSGRSSLFRVYGIMLMWCNGKWDCARGGETVRRALTSIQPARCML